MYYMYTGTYVKQYNITTIRTILFAVQKCTLSDRPIRDEPMQFYDSDDEFNKKALGEFITGNLTGHPASPPRSASTFLSK